MSNVYNEAHKLAKAIKESDEYKGYVEKKEAAYSNEKNKEMIENFMNKVLEVQREQLSGKEIDKEKIEKLNKLEDVLMLNPAIKEFFAAQLRFSQMVQDINNIIGEAIDIEED
mgnify:FL=1